MKYWLIPTTILILSLFSILTLMSIAPELAPKQLIFFVIGFNLFFLIQRFSFSTILKTSPILYIILLLLLVFTLILAPITRGTSRWIDVFGIFAIQPSQLAIPVTTLFLLNFFQNKTLKKTSNFLYFLFITAIPGLLILIEPDLGTTLIYLLSISVVLFFSQINRKLINLLLIASILLSIFSWHFILRDYQKLRITSFISSDDASNGSYNAQQSLIAVGSGQFTGNGLGQGIQSHLRFLPERQTDFIFASFAEEFGFVGSFFLLLLYFTLINSTINTAKKSNHQDENFFCLVIAVMTTIQVGVNIGMNIKILPITGITLPFMSYGGSSIISLLMTFAIVQSIKQNQKQQVKLFVI